MGYLRKMIEVLYASLVAFIFIFAMIAAFGCGIDFCNWIAGR